MEDRQKIIEKLVKIKALAERGIGGDFQRMTRICEKTGKTAITSMCPVISIIAVNAERFWIWTNGSEKKNQRQQVKN